jgi:cobyrinic acid a,c-diamide synthase
MRESTLIPRLVLAGTHSGVGKTTLAAGIIAALVRRGLRVQPFKVGPDYIDPTYHTLAAGRSCRNLDAWLIPPERIAELFGRASLDADFALVEGVMGLFDGSGYDDESGSTAEVAKLLRAPVVVVIDAAKIARSAAALACGYCEFDRELNVAGFIVNRAAGERHGRGVASAIERATDKPVFGWLPRDARLMLNERHLGLVPTVEPGRWEQFLAAAADMVERHLDIDRLINLAVAAVPFNPPPQERPRWEIGIDRPRIAVARDAAFQFIYQENLDLLAAAGAEIVFFSPLEDAALPEGTAGIILSGGFPELYAEHLSANAAMREVLVAAHLAGTFFYAECGGLMYLTEAIVDQQGREHAMVGLLPGRSIMGSKLTLGYRQGRAIDDSWLFDRGETVRGHEFHYSTWESPALDQSAAFELLPRDETERPRREGYCRGNLWASYVHLHFWSAPQLASRLVAACRREPAASLGGKDAR